MILIEKQFFGLGDCVWSKWLETDCSTTCGNGTKIRRRYSRIPADPVAGGNCENETQMIESCDVKQFCPKRGNVFVCSFHNIYK